VTAVSDVADQLHATSWSMFSRPLVFVATNTPLELTTAESTTVPVQRDAPKLPHLGVGRAVPYDQLYVAPERLDRRGGVGLGIQLARGFHEGHAWHTR